MLYRIVVGLKALRTSRSHGLYHNYECPVFVLIDRFLSYAPCYIIYPLPVPLCRFQTADGEVKYVREAEELIRPERNTLLVSYTDLEGFNQELATTIQEEYYR